MRGGRLQLSLLTVHAGANYCSHVFRAYAHCVYTSWHGRSGSSSCCTALPRAMRCYMAGTAAIKLLQLFGTCTKTVRRDIRLTFLWKPKKWQVSLLSGPGVLPSMLTTSPLMGYRYLIATCRTKCTFLACMAYDVAFRKKAGSLVSWGQIDLQLYTKAFAGSGKAQARVRLSLIL